MPHYTYTVYVSTVKAHVLKLHPCPHINFQWTSFHHNSFRNKAAFPLALDSSHRHLLPLLHLPAVTLQTCVSNLYSTAQRAATVQLLVWHATKCKSVDWKQEKFRSVPTQAACLAITFTVCLCHENCAAILQYRISAKRHTSIGSCNLKITSYFKMF